MGMAASQARYLALVARKSNCEYEGQQINQSRLILSNQSANLFNQMLGLAVPVSPSKMDYARTQYSYTDGITNYTMDKWVQLGEEDSDGYNYVVTYHYNSNIQTGSQKMKSNPQVQFSGAIPTSSTTSLDDLKKIQAAQKAVIEAQKAYDTAVNDYKSKLEEAGKLTAYQDTYSGSHILQCTPIQDGYTVQVQDKEMDEDGKIYIHYTYKNSDRYICQNDGKTYDGTGSDKTEITGEDSSLYEPVDGTLYNFEKQSGDKTEVKTLVDNLKEYGALPEDFAYDNVFYDSTSGAYAFLSSFTNVETGGKTSIPLYYYDSSNKPDGVKCNSFDEVNTELSQLKTVMNMAKSTLDAQQDAFDAMNVPSYIGNTPLTPIAELSDDQIAKIVQLVSDMKANDIDTNITRCFETLDGTYNNDTYIGGLYAFENNSTIYYTTYYDLVESVLNGEGINNIDNQKKLPIYTVGAVSTPIEKTEKAIIETDTSGRFLSIRLESDSLKYALKVETEIDEIAYEDAMNQYDYDKALYDKKVSDLNAKTKIIQQQDQDLELRLKQLDTEQNALNTEIDAVSKVVKDNIEKSFKTFGG